MLTRCGNLIVMFIGSLAVPFVVLAADVDLDQMSLRYGELRKLPGHFSGADWNPAVDAWQGEQHQLMQAIASQLVSSGSAVDRLISVLGPPDKRAARDEMLAILAQTQSGVEPNTDTEYWIYYWRAERDYLYFSVTAQKIIRADWFYSYE